MPRKVFSKVNFSFKSIQKSVSVYSSKNSCFGNTYESDRNNVF